MYIFSEIPYNMKFKVTKKEKITSQIVKQIRNAILSGELKQGQSLPKEQDLMQEFGVSKHTLREALRGLECMGLVTIKRGAGGGPIVSEIDWDIARDSFANFLYFQNFQSHDLSDVRTLIEPYIAKCATENITEAQFTLLQSVHQRCLDAYDQDDMTLLYEQEVYFHVLLGKYSGNPVLWVMQDFINTMLIDIKYHLKPTKEFAAEVIRAHQRIVDAIEERDAQKAQAAMLQHLLEVDAGLKGFEEKIANEKNLKK